MEKWSKYALDQPPPPESATDYIGLQRACIYLFTWLSIYYVYIILLFFKSLSISDIYLFIYLMID